MRILKVGSLFSGIGGIDYGLELAGLDVLWQCEVDPYCRAVLRKHWPTVHCYRDIKEISELTPRVDVLAGGFPCQPVSLAGKGKAQADPRWLWPQFERAIRILRPRYVVVENVPGLLVRGFGDVLSGLADCGYNAEWSVVSACALGAPHMRKRVFILAYANGVMGQERFRFGPSESGSVSPFHHRALRSDWVDAVARVGRNADGVPARVDRITALGNAVVPQVAEYIGRRILALEKSGA